MLEVWLDWLGCGSCVRHLPCLDPYYYDYAVSGRRSMVNYYSDLLGFGHMELPVLFPSKHMSFRWILSIAFCCLTEPEQVLFDFTLAAFKPIGDFWTNFNSYSSQQDSPDLALQKTIQALFRGSNQSSSSSISNQRYQQKWCLRWSLTLRVLELRVLSIGAPIALLGDMV